MADSLDDFFAKKDKKSKSKKNYVVPEELVQQIKENGQSAEKKKHDKDRDNAVAKLIPKLLDQIKDSEEWNDFEDEREKDYRGLRIQQMNLREEEERDILRQENEANGKKDKAGSWKINKDALPEVETTELKEKEQPAVTPDLPSPQKEKIIVDDSKGGKLSSKLSEKLDNDNSSSADTSDKVEPKVYIPPHLRGKQTSSGPSPQPPGSSKNSSSSTNTLTPVTLAPVSGASLRRAVKSNIPQINNESDFPSL